MRAQSSVSLLMNSGQNGAAQIVWHSIRLLVVEGSLNPPPAGPNLIHRTWGKSLIWPRIVTSSIAKTVGKVNLAE
jgi:hypothetical protein